MVNATDKKNDNRLLKVFRRLDIHKIEKQTPKRDGGPGRPRFPDQAIVKCYFLKLMKNWTWEEYEGEMAHDERYRKAIGCDDDFPSNSCVCDRFNEYPPSIIRFLFTKFVRKLHGRGLIIGREIAIDASLLKGWVNPRRKQSDQDAETGFSPTKGYKHGYKVHLVVDAKSGLPIAILVTPANVYDGHMMKPLLEAVLPKTGKFYCVMADKGYDANYNFEAIGEMGATPMIQIRRRSKILPGQRSLLQFMCSPTRKKAANARTQAIIDYEKHKEKRKARVVVEQVFSRAKGFLSLDCIRTRGIERVTKHVLCSFLIMLLVALAAVEEGSPKLMRSLRLFG